MTITAQQVLQLLKLNESKNPYVLSPPPTKAKSGSGTYTFGYVQLDVGNNSLAATALQNILTYALNASGQYIIDPSNTQNRLNDSVVSGLVSDAESTSSTSISAADLANIDLAMDSAYGQAEVNAVSAQWINQYVLPGAAAIASGAKSTDATFASSDLAQLFFADAVNQGSPRFQKELKNFLATGIGSNGSPAAMSNSSTRGRVKLLHLASGGRVG